MENEKTNVIKVVLHYADGSAPKTTIQNPREALNEFLFNEHKSVSKHETVVLTNKGNHVVTTVTEEGISVVVNGETIL